MAIAALVAEARHTKDAPSITGMINFGCAGAHSDKVPVGDVIVGSAVVPIGAYKVLPDGAKRFGGFKSYMGAPMLQQLETDATLRDALAKAGRATFGQAATWVGPIGSAEIWLQQRDELRAMHANFGTLCEEMEAAAAAQSCAAFGVPFGCVKDISNNELLDVSFKKDPMARSSLDLGSVGKASAAVAIRAVRQRGASGGAATPPEADGRSPRLSPSARAPSWIWRSRAQA